MESLPCGECDYVFKFYPFPEYTYSVTHRVGEHVVSRHPAWVEPDDQVLSNPL